MPQSIIYSSFSYKANHVQKLMDETAKQPIRVEVLKVIELTWKQYRYFCRHLLEDMPFIAANKKLAGCDNGVTRCLLVTTRNIRGGFWWTARVITMPAMWQICQINRC